MLTRYACYLIAQDSVDVPTTFRASEPYKEGYIRYCLCYLEQIEHGVDARHVLESEVLVVEHHPFLTFLYRHSLDVWEERKGNNQLPAIGKLHIHLAAIVGKVHVFDAKMYIFHLTHITVLLFLFFNVNSYGLLTVECPCYLFVDEVPVTVDSRNKHLVLFR